MTFAEALKALKLGSKVYRLSWPQRQYIVIEDETIMIHKNAAKMPWDEFDISSEILSDDWWVQL